MGFFAKDFAKSLQNIFIFSIIPIKFLASLDPALLSACLVAIAGLLGVILGVILVHMNFNRKKLLLGSAFGTVVSFAALGIYNMTAIIDPKGENKSKSYLNIYGWSSNSANSNTAISL